jgi:glycosyltransferase involved in cell wall biosynthesis
LISIVIPCFRAEKFLAQTLETVGEQTYQDWELIVVEDGSQDTTESIVNKFRLKNPQHRIQYLRLEKNRGPSAARNIGIKNSKGAWVAFLDSDDLWSPTHLETLLLEAEKRKVDLCFCSVDFFDSESGAILGVWGPTEDDLTHFPETLFLRNYISPSGVLVNKAVLEETVFDESAEVQSCEDHELWMRLVRQGISFAWVSDLKVKYRKNHSVAATSNREKMFRADLAVMYRHLGNPAFGFATKCKGISQNYAYLAEALLEKRNWKAVSFYFRSWCFNPFKLRQLRRLIKALGTLTLRLAD